MVAGIPPLNADAPELSGLPCGLALGESAISDGSGGSDVGIAI